MTPSPNQPNPLPDEENRTRDFAGMAGTGLQFALAVVVCGLAGNWIDGHWGSTPWGTVVGAMVGFAAGLYNILRMAKRENERADREHGGPGAGGPK